MTNQEQSEDVERLTSCLYAALRKIGGTIRISKNELEALSPIYSLSIAVEESTGDLVMTAVEEKGKPN